MTRLILYGIILVAAVLIGLFIGADPGYVLMAYRHWTVEMPLWFFVLAFLIILFVFHCGLGILDFFKNLMARWQYRRHWIGFYKTSVLTNKGLIELAEANWKVAEKDLLRAAAKSQKPLINYLALASLSQMQNDLDKCNHYLQKAYQHAPENKIAVELTQARLQIKSAQYEYALATLKRIHRRLPKNIPVLALLQKVYEQMEDWESLLEFLPTLRRYSVIPKDDYPMIELRLYRKLLIKNEQDVAKLNSLWIIIPRALKPRGELILIYTNALIKNGQADQALVILHESLQKNWSDELCELFGRIASRDPETQKAQALYWLKKQKNNVILLFSLARIEMHLHHWEEAEKYLLCILQLKEEPRVYLALVRVYDNLHQKDKALAMFNQYEKINHPAASHGE